MPRHAAEAWFAFWDVARADAFELEDAEDDGRKRAAAAHNAVKAASAVAETASKAARAAADKAKAAFADANTALSDKNKVLTAANRVAAAAAVATKAKGATHADFVAKQNADDAARKAQTDVAQATMDLTSVSVRMKTASDAAAKAETAAGAARAQIKVAKDAEEASNKIE